MNLKNVARLRFIIFLFLILFIYSNCYTKFTPTFVAVRESDFRFGPVDLPLDEADKDALLLFLAKEGDNSISDIVDYTAPQKYAGLLVLLVDGDFVADAENFKLQDKKPTVKISAELEEWFDNPIVYQIVDATKKRPPSVNPISVSDGLFWWVFYRESDGSGGFKVVRLLVTLDVMRKNH
ncbi:hypothetical protein ACFLR7_03585 [Acidobacteriota bacterium]